MQIQEIIIVEGHADVAAVHRAVDALVLTTGGTARNHLSPASLAPFAEAAGLCLLTDPDGPGNRIRERFSAAFPKALQGHIAAGDCRSKNGRLGIAYASPLTIRQALLAAGCHILSSPRPEPTLAELQAAGLVGTAAAAFRREQLCLALGIDPANGRGLKARLGALGLSVTDCLPLIADDKGGAYA